EKIGARVTSTVFEKPRIFWRSPVFEEWRRGNSKGAAQRFQRLEWAQSLHEPGNLPEARISTKEFVSSKSRKRHFQPALPGRSAHPVGIDTVNRGLIHGPHQVVEGIFKIAPGDADCPMMGAIEPSDLLGERRLVVRSSLVLVETEGDRLQTAAFFGSQSRDHSGVHTRREEYSDGH